MNKFIICTFPRCGTHMLRSSLQSHPEVAAEGEIFNQTDSSFTWMSWPFEEIYNHVAFRFTQKKACGFILHRDQGDPALWNKLSTEENLKVIWLHRGNILDVYLSYKIAAITWQWQLFENDQIAKRPLIEFSPEEFSKMNSLYWELYHEKRALFKEKNILDISYEDMVSNYSKCMSMVQDFLGVEKIEVKPKTKKAEDRKYEDIVKDYDSMKTWLGSNNMAHLLNK